MRPRHPLLALWAPTSYALQLLLPKRVMGVAAAGILDSGPRRTRAGRREGGASAAAPGTSSQPAGHGQPLSAGGVARVPGHVQDTSRTAQGTCTVDGRSLPCGGASVRLLLRLVVRLLEPRNEGGRRLAHLAAELLLRLLLVPLEEYVLVVEDVRVV